MNEGSRSPLRRWAGGAARHRGVLELLGLAALIRWQIELMRLPGVYQDSLVYLDLSEHAPFGPYSPTRPSGYPLVLRAIRGLTGEPLDHVTALQHGAGLAVGVLVYVLLIRAGVRRWIATAAAGIVVIDAYAVALEQDILAETFFTLAVTASVCLALRDPGNAWSIGVSGLLLALAATMRTVAVFIIPVWLVWVLWTRPARRTVLMAVAAVTVPIVAYCTLHARAGKGFSLVDSDGWYLYAKVGPIVDCSGVDVPAETTSLCVSPRSSDSNFYLYDAASPAHKLFVRGQNVELEQAMTHRSNVLLRKFSVAVILRHPLPYLRTVVRDFFRYLGPAGKQPELSLYGEPGSPLAFFERWFHTRWWIVAPAFAAAGVTLVAGRRPRALSLLVATTCSLLLGAAMLSGFNIRYIVPAVPFLAAAGALALEEGLAWKDR